MIEGIRVVVYRVVSFIMDNWKKSIVMIVAVYFITMGLTLFAGGGLPASLPMLNLNIPALTPAM